MNKIYIQYIIVMTRIVCVPCMYTIKRQKSDGIKIFDTDNKIIRIRKNKCRR